MLKKKLKSLMHKTVAFVLSMAMVIPTLLGTSSMVSASVGTVTHYAKYNYGGFTLGEFEVSVPQAANTHAWCAEHHKNPPYEGTPIESVERVYNDNLSKVLWYGVFGPGMIVENTQRGCTLTNLMVSIAVGNTSGIIDDDRPASVEAVALYNQIVAMPSPPSSFETYIAHTGPRAGDGGDCQDLAYFIYNPTGAIELYKSTADSSITDSNGCYSLEGAVYAIYDTNGSQVATITTDAAGYGKVEGIAQGNYTIKEIKASPGYALDENTYPVTVNGSVVTTVRVEEQPTNDPMALTIEKIDKESGSSDTQGTASLEGAEFTVKYYAGYYTKDDLPEKATRTWVIQTKAAQNSSGKTVYRAMLSEAYKVSGDEFFYTGNNPNPTLPLGTVTIEETKAPAGYKLEGATITANGSEEEFSEVYIAQITQDGNLASINVGNEFKASDSVIRGDFEFSKRDAETQNTMANIPFKITSNTTDENHTIHTDENGYWSSAAEYISHSAENGVWFGEGEPDDSKGAFPYDTYTVEEQRCDANEGKQLVKFTVTISRDGYTVDMGTIENSDVSLTTVAKDENTNSHYSVAEAEAIIIDTVHYTGLKKGETYTLVGTLMNKATGQPVTDAQGNPVTATRTFTPATAEGTTENEFIFDASSLGGSDVVVFEKVYLGETEIVAHEDINDIDQTIHFPGIETTAIDSDTDTNVSNADKEITIVDTVAYTNLRTGRTYKVTGTLMDKETGEPILDADGNEITASTEFKAENSSGTVEVTFKFDGSNLGGKTVVAFEELEYKDKTYAVHADINDEAQTVYFPEIATTAVDSDTGIQNSYADGEITIVDTVAYENVVPGKEYTVKGILMDKSTGKALKIDGKEVTAQAKFTPESAEGTVDVRYTFDGTGLEGSTFVVFEELYLNGAVVAEHKDIEDEGQTVYVPEIATTAVDDESGSHTANADKTVTIVDTVKYENLIPGKTYTVKGTLMDEETGKPLLAKVVTNVIPGAAHKDLETGKVIISDPTYYYSDTEQQVTAEATFTPDKANGSVELKFMFDGSALAGKTVVAFEDVSYEGKTVATHTDIEDEDQTVHFPEIKTSAIDSESRMQNSNADEEVTIVDTVTYKNLVPGKEYTLSGTIMNKATGEPLLVDGKEVTASKTFIPKNADGTVDLEFTFDGSALKGETVVVFENLLINDTVIAVHEDIEDEGQTIYFPELGTQALDGETDIQNALADEEVTIIDTVRYENLIPGTEYTVKGVLMDQETEEPLLIDGEKVTAETTFTAEAASGSIEMTFTFDGSALAGKTVVIFENLLTNGVVVGVHADIEDDNQTVWFPEIGTTAVDDENGTHNSNADNEVTIVDTVEYNNLIPGKEYKVSGKLMNKETGEPLLVNGAEVTGETVFTPEEPSGTVEVVFKFDGSALKGQAVVAFETVTYEDVPVAVHEDIEDEDQTVWFPEIGTTATDKADGDHSITSKGTVTIVDKVEYSNLIVGQTYKLSGTLMDKATGKPVAVNGKEVTAETEFTAETESGSVEVEFTFDASGLGNKTTVVFESLTVEGKEVAAHTDINDEAQTIEFKAPPVTPKTGDDTNIALYAGTGGAALTAAAALAFFKKKRKTAK